MLSKAYITDDEIDFIRSFMWDNTGAILEVGAYVGKTFHRLHKYRPDWEYTGIDPWELYPFPMTDPNVPYDSKADAPLLHSKYFRENCPFSHFIVSDYEKCLFEDCSFDIIVMSACSTWMDTFYMWQKAIREIKEDGVIIGRHLNHYKYKEPIIKILDIIKPKNIMHYNESMFAIW